MGAVKSWWQNVKDFVGGAAAVGEAAAPAVYKKAGELVNQPNVPESWVPYAQPATVPQAIAHSAGEFARGMTSAENIGLGALMGPVGKIAPLVTKAVGGVFSVQMLKTMVDQYPEIKDAVQKGDWTRAAGAITTAALSGGLGVMAGTHAVRGGPETAPIAETSPLDKATASARAGVDALTPETPASFEPEVAASGTESTPAAAPAGAAAAEPVADSGTPPSFTPERSTPESFVPDQAPQASRTPETPPALGRDAHVLVPGETTTYPARYAVRELADIQASHNAFNFEPNPNYDYTNDRDYSRPQNAARVVANAAPDTFNPDYPTTDSPTAEHGAPIIDASGNVLGGNSRTMSIARVYQRGGEDAQAYQDAIAAKAQQFGIDPAELERFDKPVLVRELGGGIDAQRAITDFNKAAPAALSPEEQAVADGRRLSPETVTKIATNIQDVGPEGTLVESLRGDNGADIINSLVKDGVLTEQEKGGYLDDKGNLTPDAKGRIAKALVGRLFDTPAEYRETTPAVRAKLERIAPQALRVEGRPDWAVTDRLKEGIALAEDARVHKMPVEDAAAQSVIGGTRSYSPEAIDIAKTLERGPVNAAKAFRGYANDEALSRPGAQTQFFTPPTRAEAFRDAFGREPASATTLGGGLGAFEPFFRESREEGRALLEKRRAAMKAVDARAGTPEQQKAGEAMRHWFTGERDLWSTRVNQAIDRASRLFTPDAKTREAVGIMREFAHRPGELEKFLDGSHPILAGADQATLDRVEALRPAMRQALAPTEKMLKTNRVYTNIAQKSLEEGEAGGWLGSRWKSDEYMPHLLHGGQDQGEAPAPRPTRSNWSATSASTSNSPSGATTNTRPCCTRSRTARFRKPWIRRTPSPSMGPTSRERGLRTYSRRRWQPPEWVAGARSTRLRTAGCRWPRTPMSSRAACRAEARSGSSCRRLFRRR